MEVKKNVNCGRKSQTYLIKRGLEPKMSDIFQTSNCDYFTPDLIIFEKWFTLSEWFSFGPSLIFY